MAERKAHEQLAAIRRACNDALPAALKMGPLAKVEMDGFEIRVLKMRRGGSAGAASSASASVSASALVGFDPRQLETAVAVLLSSIFRRLESKKHTVSALLEPIMKVRVHVPSDATSRVNALISGRRGALLGFDARPGWRGWDTVQAELPLSEVSDLIVDLRSLTQGVGTYEMEFDRLSELNGKLADQVVATRSAA